MASSHDIRIAEVVPPTALCTHHVYKMIRALERSWETSVKKCTKVWVTVREWRAVGGRQPIQLGVVTLQQHVVNVYSRRWRGRFVARG